VVVRGAVDVGAVDRVVELRRDVDVRVVDLSVDDELLLTEAI